VLCPIMRADGVSSIERGVDFQIKEGSLATKYKLETHPTTISLRQQEILHLFCQVGVDKQKGSHELKIPRIRSHELKIPRIISKAFHHTLRER